MCNIPVNLPTLASCLMLYSLRWGCIICCMWTLIRSLFVLAFFVTTLLLMYMPDSSQKDSQPEDNYFFYVIPPYLTMIVTESFVFMASITLAMGLSCDKSFRVSEYLVSRFCSMVLETIALVCLCFFHRHYIGWYLGFLIIIILEIYAFMIVYSYYVDLANEEKEYCEHQGQMGECPSYKNCHDLCVNYLMNREPSLCGVSQDTQDIEASQVTTGTPDTGPTGDMRTRSDKRKQKDEQNRDKRLTQQLLRIMHYK